MSFVHLHVHTQYSLLDGFSNIKKLVKHAKALGMPAIAATDHGVMLGTIDFFNAATAEGIKPIIGLETYMAARRMTDREEPDRRSFHQILLAENMEGYLNLIQVASASQLEGFYYYPRIDHDYLAAHSVGLIATSACIAGEIPRAIQARDMEKARGLVGFYRDVFGPDRFYLELQEHVGVLDLQRINQELIALGREFDVPLIATNDVHYVNRQDARLQDLLMCVQTGSKLNDPRRLKHEDDSYYLRSAAEMAALFSEVPEAVTNSLLIAERCNVDLKNEGYHLPEFPVPDGYTAGTYLRRLCEEGLERRYGAKKNDPQIQERVEYELGVIHRMGFDAYFLIVWDLIRYAQRRNIWYNARGSGSGSIVGYLLEITSVEPLEFGLIFERFLNPERVSMPDIDLDFQDDRRTEVMAYCAAKYGNDHVASIITFTQMGGKSAVRDVGRVMDLPLSTVDRVAKLIPDGANAMSLAQAIKEVPELAREAEDATIGELLNTAAAMEGTIRGVGTHAAGVVITDKPLTAYAPLHRPTSKSDDAPIKQVVQFEMGVVDTQGLLKVDFLGLSTLTIMQRACNMIKARHGVDLNLNNIPTDDPGIFDLLGRGDTAGVFQVESAGMRKYLREMKPQHLNNIIAMVALYRPGPLDFIPSYIARMHGDEAVEYKHPELANYFADTFGIPVYQEQLMFTVQGMAGYTMSEADDFRKAISKKQKDKIEKHKAKFIKGASHREVNPVPVEVAEAIFEEWQGFARYAFNKAHAADYGIICAQTAYLKVHYGIEYMTALLTVNAHDKVKIAEYIAECRAMEIQILPPSVNTSELSFSIEDRDNKSVIRFGLGAIKNVGEGPVSEIVTVRTAGGPFLGIADFILRVNLKKANKRVRDSLIKAGAFDDFGSRTEMLDVLEELIKIASKKPRGYELALRKADQRIAESRETARMRKENLAAEKEVLGLYISEHPVSAYAKQLEKAVTHLSSQLGETINDEIVTVGGAVINIKPHVSKNGKQMAFVTIEDTLGDIDLVIFPTVWQDFQEMFIEGSVLLFKGRISQKDGQKSSILVNHVSDDLMEIEQKAEQANESDANAQSVYEREARKMTRRGATIEMQALFDLAAVASAPEVPLELPHGPAEVIHNHESGEWLIVGGKWSIEKTRFVFQTLAQIGLTHPGKQRVAIRFFSDGFLWQITLPNLPINLTSAEVIHKINRLVAADEYNIV